ncbi:DUF2963 domain-containing protein [Candidatus Phytoplasma ziziphi]|uniref:DUF2963 domain-containing protein n=1 Tax=Candidatus Phytoplasma TaxID=33926 RepID=UPI003B968794
MKKLHQQFQFWNDRAKIKFIFDYDKYTGTYITQKTFRFNRVLTTQYFVTYGKFTENFIKLIAFKLDSQTKNYTINYNSLTRKIIKNIFYKINGKNIKFINFYSKTNRLINKVFL